MQFAFQQYRPDNRLAPFIEAYWQFCTDAGSNILRRVVPDGCVDLIINRGEDLEIDGGKHKLKHGGVYLGGALTKYMDAVFSDGLDVAGIRFRPGALDHFVNLPSLHEFADGFYESNFFDLPSSTFKPGNVAGKFDMYFGKLFRPGSLHTIAPVINTIQSAKGIITVGELASMHYTTVRQLERRFRRFVGLTPKEFINITRCRNAAFYVQQHYPSVSLAEIAFEFGYYDHAHLTNEMIRLCGYAPSAYHLPLNNMIA